MSSPATPFPEGGHTYTSAARMGPNNRSNAMLLSRLRLMARMLPVPVRRCRRFFNKKYDTCRMSTALCHVARRLGGHEFYEWF